MAAAAKDDRFETQTRTIYSPFGEVEIGIDDGVPKLAAFEGNTIDFLSSKDEYGIYTYTADFEYLQVRISGLYTEVFVPEECLYKIGHSIYLKVETDIEFGRTRTLETSLANFIQSMIAMNTAGKIARTGDEGSTQNQKITQILVQRGIIQNPEIARLLVNYFSRNFTTNMRGVYTYELPKNVAEA